MKLVVGGYGWDRTNSELADLGVTARCPTFKASYPLHQQEKERATPNICGSDRVSELLPTRQYSFSRPRSFLLPLLLPGKGFRCSSMQAGRQSPHMRHRDTHAFGASEGFAFTNNAAPSRVALPIGHPLLLSGKERALRCWPRTFTGSPCNDQGQVATCWWPEVIPALRGWPYLPRPANARFCGLTPTSLRRTSVSPLRIHQHSVRDPRFFQKPLLSFQKVGCGSL